MRLARFTVYMIPFEKTLPRHHPGNVGSSTEVSGKRQEPMPLVLGHEGPKMLRSDQHGKKRKVKRAQSE